MVLYPRLSSPLPMLLKVAVSHSLLLLQKYTRSHTTFLCLHPKHLIQTHLPQLVHMNVITQSLSPTAKYFPKSLSTTSLSEYLMCTIRFCQSIAARRHSRPHFLW